jgi:hypothetical protein
MPHPAVKHQQVALRRLPRHGVPMEDVPQHASAEIIYCRQRARQAREKAEAAATTETKAKYVAAEARWLGLARSHEAQRRLARMLSAGAGNCPNGGAEKHPFNADVAATIDAAFRAVVAELDLSDRDESAALRAAGIIIKLASEGELDPGRLQTAAMRWVTK